MAETKASSESSKPANGKAEVVPDVLKGSPVLMAIAKRMRAAKKRLGRIEEIEVKKAAGKEINADQVEALKAKPGVLAVIDELEKLTVLVKEALDEEIAKAAETAVTEALAASKPPEPEAPVEEENVLKVNEELVDKLVQLLYFSQVFNPVDGDERTLCLQLEYTNESEGVPLTAADLEAIHVLGKLLTSRANGQLLNHKDALESCKALVYKLLKDEDEFIPELNVTLRDIFVKLDRILNSDFVTMAPQPPALPEKIPTPVQDDSVILQQQHLQQMLPQEAYPQIPQLPVQPPSVPSQMMHSLQPVPHAASAAPLPVNPPEPAQLPDEPEAVLSGSDVMTEPNSQAPPQAVPAPRGYYPTFHHHHHQPGYLPAVPPPTNTNALQPHTANGHYVLPDNVPGYGFLGDTPVVMEGVPESVLMAPAALEAGAPTGQMPQGGGTGGRGSGGYNGRRGPGGDRGRGGRGRRGDGSFVPRGDGYGRGSGRGQYRGRGGGRGGRGRSFQPAQVAVV